VIARADPGTSRADGRIDRQTPGLSNRVSGHVVGAITLALSLALLWLAWMFARPLALLAAAVILANALEPVVDWLMRRMRRTFAIATIAITLLAAIAIAGAVIVPNVRSQVQEVAQNLPTMIERAQQLARQWIPVTGGLGQALFQPSGSEGGGEGGSGGSRLTSLPLAIVSSAFEVVLVVVLSLYWLAALPTLRAFLISLLPPDRTEETRSVLEEIGQTMGGYVRGVLIEATLISTIVFFGLWIIGVQYPLALAVLAGLGEFMPYVGPIMAATPAVLLALLESPTQALIVLGFYVGLQMVEGYLLFPLVVGNQSEIPPLLIIVGLLAGGTIGGVLGALVAIPLAGALRILALRVVAPAVRRRTGGIERSPEAEERRMVTA
jgi:predicted PurR-regulated permease PerM